MGFVRLATAARTVGVGMVMLIGGAACDGTAGEGNDEPGLVPADPATEMQAEAPRAPQIDDSVARAIAEGRPADVLLVLDDSAVRRAALGAIGGLERAMDDVDLRRLNGAYADLKSRVVGRAPGARVLRPLDHLPVTEVRIADAETLAALAASPEVVRIAADTRYAATVDTNLTLVNQPSAAGAGKIGEGTSVVVIDTGLDYTRDAFGACTAAGAPAACRVPFVKDFATDDSALDDMGHGTNVAGIVAAMAPGAKVIGLDVFTNGWANASSILSALSWTIENKAKYNVAAVNLSLGSGSFSAACGNDTFAAALANVRAAGIVPVAASGNDAKSTGIASPACAPAAVSVGAVYSTNVGSVRSTACSDAATAADQVTCFSNSAAFLTLLAPGAFINAAGSTMSGTSQAAPHVAGAVAVLRAAFPTESVDQLVKRLTSTGKKITDARNKVVTPRLDVGAALASSAPAPTGDAKVSAPKGPAPAGTVTINKGARFTKSPSVTLDFTITAGTAAQVCATTAATCTAWTAAKPSLSFALPTGDGAKAVSVWWKDAAGTVSAQPAKATITLDTTAPKDGRLGGTLTSSSLAWTWSGFTDSGSGIASYKIVVSTKSTPASCNVTALYEGAAAAYTARFTGKGNYFFRLCAVDNVGNVSPGITTQVVVR